MRKIVIFLTFLITACSGGGGDTASPPTPTPAPGISFSATPTSVLLNNASTFSWSTTNATSCTASGSNNWTGTKATSGTEDVSIDIAGNTVFTLSCSGAGGTRNASFTIEGYRQTDGVVVDGYISGADVFIDENANFIADASENATISDNDGKFTIKYANGSLVSIGGTDLDSQTLLDNLLITHKLDGYSDFKAITPVTSVDAFLESVDVNAALGIDSSINVGIADPVALKGDGGIYDYLYEKGNQLTVLAFALQNITNDLNTTTETTQDYFKAIAEEVEKEFSETSVRVDIETENFINKTLENVIAAKGVTIDEAAKDNTVKALSNISTVIQVKESAEVTSAILRFAVSTLQEDIKAVANGTASAETVASYTNNIIDYIAQDQNLDPKKVEPAIFAINDSITTAEDTPVNVQVIANDSYITTAPISVSATNGDNGTAEVAESSPEQITYTPNKHYNGTDTFSYTITQGDKVSMADVNVTINPVNDEPSIDIASTIRVAENQTAVTTVTISDVDGDDLILSLGGTDADSFNLSSTNVLTFKEAPDYETKNSYSIELSLTDGLISISRNLVINIIDVVEYNLIGRAIDGYIEGANVFIDQNFNFELDEGEISGITDETGKFVLTTSNEDLYQCLIKRPIVADVPEGAIDSSLGEVTQAYQMILPSIYDNELDQIVISPFTTLLGEAIINAKLKSNLDEELSIDEGCNTKGNSIAQLITNEINQIKNSIESSLNISYQDLLVDFIENPSSSLLTEEVAQKLASFFPYFISLGNEFDDELSEIHGKEINTDIVLSTKVVTDILSTGEINNLPLSFSAIYESDPASNGWFIQDKIEANGALINNNGELIHFACFTKPEDCTTNDINFSTLKNASSRYFKTSSYLNNDYKPQKYNYILNTEDSQIVYYDIDNNPAYRTCVYQNWLYLSTKDNQENYQRNDRYSTGYSESYTNNDDCSVLKTDNTESLFVALVDTFTASSFYENFEVRISNPIYENSIFFKNKVNNIYENRDNLNINPLIQEISQVPRAFKDINNLREMTNEESGDDISIVWYKRDAEGRLLESIEYKIGNHPDDDLYRYGVYILGENSEEYIEQERSMGQNARIDIFNKVFNLSEGFNSETYLGSSPADNPAPVFISSPNFQIDENKVEIGKVKVTDLNNNQIEYDITSTDIQISSSGELSFINPPDYENQTSYDATVIASNGRYSTKQIIKVSINNLNDNEPKINTSANFSVNEGYYDIGFIGATDDDGDNLEFSITGADIKIDKDSGNLTFLIETDYESKDEYMEIVTVSDGVYSASQAIKVSIININDSTPVFISENEFNVDENALYIGTVQATDPDGDEVTYSVNESNINIGASSGVMTFLDPLDYEIVQGAQVQVFASDGINVVSQDISIFINNLNDNEPVITSENQYYIDENQLDIGFAAATDADGDEISYSISDEGITIDPVTGWMQFINTPDFETFQGLEVTLFVTDGLYVTKKEISIFINNLNDNSPKFTSEDSYFVDENQLDIGFAAATDADGDEISYSISDEGITIDPVTGWMQFINTPDFETFQGLEVTLFVTDGLYVTKKEISIFINNLNDSSPNWVSEPIFNIDENEKIIGNIQAEDADGDTLSYSISNNLISIDSSSGLMEFIEPVDYEELTTHQATVTANDGVNETTQDISINVININDNSPIITSSNEFSIKENSTEVGRVIANDADGDGIIFNITSDSDLSIDSSSGVIYFDQAPDYETASTHLASVNVSDGIFSTSQNIIVNVINVNEAPSFTSMTSFKTLESQTYIGRVTVIDPEGDDLSYTVASNEISISSQGELSFLEAPLYDNKSIYNTTLSVTDGINTSSQDISIYILEAESDSPIVTDLTVSPSQIDITNNSAEVTYTIRVVDPSGAKPTFSGSWKTGNEAAYGAGNLVLISGDKYDGVWQSITTFPTTLKPGDYTINNIRIEDEWNNPTILSSDGSPLEVVNENAESDSPIVTDLTVSPSQIDITNNSAEVTYTIRVVDPSGAKPTFSGSWKTGNEAAYGAGNLVLISGDKYDGVWQSITTFPTTLKPGDYTINNIRIEDEWNNPTILSSDGSPLEVVNENAESDSPIVTDLTVSPSQIDITNNSAEVTYTIRVVDPSGAKPTFSGSWKTGNEAAYGAGNLVLISGDKYDGVWQSITTFPTTLKPGDYTINNIRIEDEWNNPTILSSDGSPLEVLNYKFDNTAITPNHWDQHQENLNKIKNEYINPIGFNLDKVWFSSLNINKDKFSTTRTDYFFEDQYFQGTVGFNTWFANDEATYHFNCNWVPQVPSEGATKIFKFIDGEFDQLIYQKNEGCNHPYSIKNKDGSYQHIFLGLDEGKLGTGSAAFGDTYTFNTVNNGFINLNFRIGSHGQHIFDYEEDGDEDIISNDFAKNVSSGNPFILKNDGENNFSVVMVPMPDFIDKGFLRYAAMSAAAYYESGYLKVVFTDFDVHKELDNRWGIEPEKNVLVTYDPDNFDIIDITQLPTPYAELNFENLEYYNQSWVGKYGLSHDVRSTPIDIDYDGDIDIVIGSQSYGEVISFPQILINNNGIFEDQTESRLFNWVYTTGGLHRWEFADVNGDGYLDIITNDGCINLIENLSAELIDIRPNGCEFKVAVNDGTGHFVAIIEPTHILQVFEGNEYKTGRIFPIFAMDKNRNLSWVYADGKGCNGCYNEGKHEIFTVRLDSIISTGPNGIDPAVRGEPGFNEFFYLLRYSDARDAVSNGQYRNGLEHYIAVGKNLGYLANAKSLTSVVVNSYGPNPIYSVQ